MVLGAHSRLEWSDSLNAVRIDDVWNDRPPTVVVESWHEVRGPARRRRRVRNDILIRFESMKSKRRNERIQVNWISNKVVLNQTN